MIEQALEQALQEADQELKRVKLRIDEIDEDLARLAEIQSERATLTVQYNQLHAESEGLRFAIARRRGEVGGPQPFEDWSKLPRVRAVAKVLQEAQGPMSPGEIERVLEQHGRKGRDPQKGISVVLMRMQAKGIVSHAARGEWIWSWPSGKEDGLLEGGGDDDGAP